MYSKHKQKINFFVIKPKLSHHKNMSECANSCRTGFVISCNKIIKVLENKKFELLT